LSLPHLLLEIVLNVHSALHDVILRLPYDVGDSLTKWFEQRALYFGREMAIDHDGNSFQFGNASKALLACSLQLLINANVTTPS
jgi:hypothetical protein